MHTKDDVAFLIDHIGSVEIDPAVETEVTQFGLAAHAFDPFSGQIITLAQPQRSDGQAEILLTPAQAEHAIAASRSNHLHNIRAQGYASLDDYNARQAQATAARELARKQEVERAKLAEEQAEEATKVAADAAPRPVEGEDKREESLEAQMAREGNRTAPQPAQVHA